MKPEVKSILYSFIPGFLLVLILSIIKYYEVQTETSFASYGLFPRSVPDLRGIITFPLIHKDYDHLFSNAIPLFILMAMLRYFYREVSLKVFLLTWILGGLWLWLGGRASYHIGASGLVYGLSSFIFFSGIWRRERRMLAVSFIVVFLYGGMVWGIFPWFKETSWEGHLFGGLAGLLLSWTYRKEGPQRTKYQWEDEPDEFEEFENLKMGEFEDLPMRETGLKMDEFEDLPMRETGLSGGAAPDREQKSPEGDGASRKMGGSPYAGDRFEDVETDLSGGAAPDREQKSPEGDGASRKMGEFEDLKMGRFEDLKMGDIIESGLKDGEEEMKLEDGEELKESEKVVGQDLFDLSSPKITYEYIEPKKDEDRNRAGRQAGADDASSKDSDKR
jgi:membrane associated rhomboid family serine protease